MADVETVVIARGTQRIRQPATATSPDDLRGRSGNIRAPLVRVGDTLVVGFAPDTLDDLLG